MKLNFFLIFEIIIVKTFPIFSLFLFKKSFIDPNYILPEKRNIKVLFKNFQSVKVRNILCSPYIILKY